MLQSGRFGFGSSSCWAVAVAVGWVLLGTLQPYPGFASETNGVVRLAPVIVLASPMLAGDTVSPFGGTVSWVDAVQFQQINATDLPTALRHIPGVTISRFNPVGAFGGADGGALYIRGQGAGRPGSEITVYQDGVPREVGVWGHPLMDVAPVSFVSDVAVYKGPQPAHYGGTFGAVDVRGVRRDQPGYEGRLHLALGAHQTRIVSLGVGGLQDGIDYFVGGAWTRADGHRPHSATELRSCYARLGQSLSATVRLSYIVNHTDNWSEDPGREDAPTPLRERFASDTWTHALRLDAEGERLSGFWVAYVEDGRIRWTQDRIGGPDSPSGQSATDWRNFGWRASFDVQGGSGWVLTPGVDAKWEGGDSRTTTLAGQTQFAFEDRFLTLSPALAARVAHSIGDSLYLTPSAGVRFYRHDTFDAEWAPHAGVLLENGRWSHALSYARGVNYPGVYAVGASSATLEHLAAETVNHFEWSNRWRPHQRLRTHLAVFRTEGDNRLARTPEGLVNIGRIDQTGVELSVLAAPLERLSLFGGGTWLNPDDVYAPRAPEYVFSAGVQWSLPRGFHWMLDAEWVDSQYAINARAPEGLRRTAEKLGAFTLLNTRLAYDLAALLPVMGEWYLSVENLFDADYAYLPGYPMPGRSVMSGIHLRF